jgi:hypothetical protein
MSCITKCQCFKGHFSEVNDCFASYNNNFLRFGWLYSPNGTRELPDGIDGVCRHVVAQIQTPVLALHSDVAAMSGGHTHT